MKSLLAVALAASAFLPARTSGELLIVDSAHSQVRIVDAGTGRGRTIANAMQAMWSPDGRWVAVAGRRGLFLIHPDRSGFRELTHAEHDHDPVWSPDGTRIAFLRQEVLNPTFSRDDLMIVDVGTGTVRSIAGDASNKSDLSWSPDGRLLAFERYSPLHTRPVVVDVETGTPAETWLGSNYPIWSPNGKTVAYVEFLSGRHTAYELHVARIDGSDDRALFRGGWDLPISDIAWSPNDRWITFVYGGWSLGRVDVHTARRTQLALGLRACPGVWARVPVRRVCHLVRYRYAQPSWSPDGRRIAFVRWRGPREVVAVVRSNGGRVRVLGIPGERPTWRPRAQNR